MKRNFKLYSDISIKEIKENGAIRFRLTELKVDRDGEVVVPKGVDLKNYKINPIVLFRHGFGSPIPIGKVDVKSIEQTDKFIDADVIFDEEGKDPFAEMIGDKVRNGFLNAGSIGFRVIESTSEPILPKQTGDTLEKTELIEYSIVPIPALQSSLAHREWKDFEYKCKELGHEIEKDWFDQSLNLYTQKTIGDKIKDSKFAIELNNAIEFLRKNGLYTISKEDFERFEKQEPENIEQHIIELNNIIEKMKSLKEPDVYDYVRGTFNISRLDSEMNGLRQMIEAQRCPN